MISDQTFPLLIREVIAALERADAYQADRHAARLLHFVQGKLTPFVDPSVLGKGKIIKPWAGEAEYDALVNLEWNVKAASSQLAGGKIEEALATLRLLAEEWPLASD